MAYINNIIIYSDNIKEYTLYVRKVLEHLIKARLKINIKKCDLELRRPSS